MWKGLVLRSFTENALTQKPLNIVGDGSAKGGLYILKIWQELML